MACHCTTLHRIALHCTSRRYLNDSQTCFDPNFQAYTPPLTFPDRSAETVDKAYSAAATDATACGTDAGGGAGSDSDSSNSNGSGLLGLFALQVADKCGADGADSADGECTDACFAVVKDAVCSHDELAGFEHQCDVEAAVAARGCTMPRCSSQSRTQEGCRCQKSFTYVPTTSSALL